MAWEIREEWECKNDGCHKRYVSKQVWFSMKSFLSPGVPSDVKEGFDAHELIPTCPVCKFGILGRRTMEPGVITVEIPDGVLGIWKEEPYGVGSHPYV